MDNRLCVECFKKIIDKEHYSNAELVLTDYIDVCKECGKEIQTVDYIRHTYNSSL